MHKLNCFVKAHPVTAGCSLLLFIIFLLICRPFGLYFLCDDFAHIPQMTAHTWLQTHLLRPVSNISLWIDFHLWGVHAEGYHVTNLVFHIVNVSLIFLLTRELLKNSVLRATNHPSFAALVALLFLCYAFHSEPLFWITGRGGSLSEIFVQLAILFYLKSRSGYLLLSIAFFVLGLLTYELSWTIPLVITALWMYNVWYLKKVSSGLPVLLYWAVLAMYLFVRYTFYTTSLGLYEAGNLLSSNYLKLVYNYTALLLRVFVPPSESSRWFVVSSVLIFSFIAVLFIRLHKRSRVQFAFAVFLLLCLLISLLPVISMGIDTHDTESERFIYPASVFACILVVTLLHGCFTIKHLYIIMLILCSIHLAFLYNASVAYRYASYVSRLTITSLNSVLNAKQLTLNQLPTQYRGALIFRIGFPKKSPGILKASYDTVVIHSFQELTERKPFIITHDRSEGHTQQLDVAFVGDTLKLQY